MIKEYLEKHKRFGSVDGEGFLGMIVNGSAEEMNGIDKPRHVGAKRASPGFTEKNGRTARAATAALRTGAEN